MRLVAYLVVSAAVITAVFVVFDGTAVWIALAVASFLIGIGGRFVTPRDERGPWRVPRRTA
jgi:hypothetical protein